MLTLRPGLLYETIENETIIVLNETSRIISLNEMGTELFQMIENMPQSFEAMASYVYGKYEVSHNKAYCDLQDFIKDLKDFNIIIETTD